MPEQHSIRDSIYWVEVERINPNPYQPRKVFDEAALASLAESIRQYGVLQPLTVTRKETIIPEGGIRVDYELIAGERRLRASKLAGLREVPVVIRTAEDSDVVKLELAIIENLQREDLNPVDRALAFEQLSKEFKLTHAEIGKKVGKSREYVSNTLRILMLPKDMQEALRSGDISEGHTRPLLMLGDRVDEQKVLFKDIIDKKLTVRDTESLARRIAVDKSRKGDLTPELLMLERELTDALGTRVRIEKKEQGGKLLIDFFSAEDLANIRKMLAQRTSDAIPAVAAATATVVPSEPVQPQSIPVVPEPPQPVSIPVQVVQEAPAVQKPEAKEKTNDDDIYFISNFTV